MCTCETLRCPECRAVLRVWYQSGVETIGCARCGCVFPIETNVNEVCDNLPAAAEAAVVRPRDAWGISPRNLKLGLEARPVCEQLELERHSYGIRA